MGLFRLPSLLVSPLAETLYFRSDYDGNQRSGHNLYDRIYCGARHITPDPVTQPFREQLSRKEMLVAAGLVFFASLLVYLWTLAPTVTLVDSGELIVAARFLGVAHPPGFPLYLMLAHFFSLVPVGNIAFRINLASAFFAAIASGVLALVTAELVASGAHVAEEKGRLSKRKNKPSRSGVLEDHERRSSDWMVRIAPAVGSGLLLAFSRTLWSYATIAEVYALNTLLVVTILFLILRWRRCILEDARYTPRRTKSSHRRGVITRYDWLLYAAAIVFGLALGVHHVTIALLLPALAAIVYRTQGLGFFTSKIAGAFQQMLQSFVSKELEIAPVAVTAEAILMKEDPDVDLIRWLNRNFRPVPRGLVFELARDNDFHDPGEPRLQTRGLTDGTIRFAENDVVRAKVLPIYKAMWQSRGQYLTHFNLPERAAAAFEQERRFDPQHVQ